MMVKGLFNGVMAATDRFDEIRDQSVDAIGTESFFYWDGARSRYSYFSYLNSLQGVRFSYLTSFG